MKVYLHKVKQGSAAGFAAMDGRDGPNTVETLGTYDTMQKAMDAKIRRDHKIANRETLLGIGSFDIGSSWIESEEVE